MIENTASRIGSGRSLLDFWRFYTHLDHRFILKVDCSPPITLYAYDASSNKCSKHRAKTSILSECTQTCLVRMRILTCRSHVLFYVMYYWFPWVSPGCKYWNELRLCKLLRGNKSAMLAFVTQQHPCSSSLKSIHREKRLFGNANLFFSRFWILE